MDIFALYHSVFNDFIEEKKKADEKRRKSLPFQMTPAVLDEEYKKRFNINDNEVHYRITKNGEPIHNGLFSFYITDSTDEMNTNRFVMMNAGVEAETEFNNKAEELVQTVENMTRRLKNGGSASILPFCFRRKRCSCADYFLWRGGPCF